MRITPSSEGWLANDVVVSDIEATDVADGVVNVDDLTMVATDVVEPEDFVAIEHLEVDAETCERVSVFWSSHAIVALSVFIVVGHYTHVTATLSGLYEMIHDQGADAVVSEDEVLNPDTTLGIVDVVDQGFELVVSIGIQ